MKLSNHIALASILSNVVELMRFIVVITSYEKVEIISIPKGPVYWDKLGNDTSTQIQHWVTNADITNLHGLFHTLGIPVSGVGLWLLAGFVRTR
ncbi:MAG TPA: hypothetical protein VEL11_07470 [Candidatus Bathyarchaeia archaeon]|nr:hypothetical protein [Candidatus Bathyarchaeia archaeon]